MATPTPLQPRGGLLDMMGQGDSGFAGWLDPRRNAIINFGAGMIGHDTNKGRLAGAAQGLQTGRKEDTAQALLMEERAQAQQQLQQQTAERNQTLEWLKTNFPQYASLPPAQGFQLATAEMGRASGVGSSYSQTPVFLRDPEGNHHIAQMSSGGGLLVNGEMMNGLPQGWSVTNRPQGMSTFDAGGAQYVFDPNTGAYTPGPAIQGSPSQDMNVSIDPVTGQRTMAPAPGSGAARDQSQADTARQLAGRQADERGAYIINAIDSALEGSGWWTTGIAGRAGRAIGLPSHVQLEETVNTVKSNLGFNELQAMRDASPTGGALGQVTERELAFLQNTVASLNPDMGEEALDSNLRLIRNLIQRQAVYREIDRAGLDINSPQAQQMLSQFPLPGGPVISRNGGGAGGNDPLGLR